MGENCGEINFYEGTEGERGPGGQRLRAAGPAALVPNLRGEAKSRLKRHCSSCEEGTSETENEMTLTAGSLLLNKLQANTCHD